MHLDCIPCIQQQVLQAARLVTDNEKLQEQILREVLEELIRSDWTTRTTIMATRTQQIIKNITGNDDPYSEPKAKYNQLALEMYPELQRLILNSEKPFSTALKLSIAGNIIDFGALRSFDINQTIRKVLNSPLTVDHSSILQKRVKKASRIVYLADNTGEIVFDKLFIKTILKINPLVKFTFVVKKNPFINDAMLSDAIDIRMNSIPQVEFYEVGHDRCDPDFIAFLRKFDVVISKGQANFEDLKDFDFIFFLFIVKCALVATETNVPLGSTLVKINEE